MVLALVTLLLTLPPPPKLCQNMEDDVTARTWEQAVSGEQQKTESVFFFLKNAAVTPFRWNGPLQSRLLGRSLHEKN